MHRDWFDGAELGDPVPADWDYILADVFQIIADNTDDNGHLRWEADHDNVTFDATKRINKAQAAIDRKTKGTKDKPYKPADGETWVTKPRLMNKSLGWPTFEDYLKQEMKKNPPSD